MAVNRQLVLTPFEGERTAIKTIGFLHSAPRFFGSQDGERAADVLAQANELHLGALSGEEVAHRFGSEITVLLGDEEGGGLGHHSGCFGDWAGWVRLPSLSEDLANIQLSFAYTSIEAKKVRIKKGPGGPVV